MRIAFLTALFVAALSGCSGKQDATSGSAGNTGAARDGRSAIEMVQPGQDVTWADGTVLNVTKRDGNSIEGVRVVQTALNGQQTMLEADKGTISAAGKNAVSITLLDVTTTHGKVQMHAQRMNLSFSK